MDGTRDVLVTGMGFCLPGSPGPVETEAEFWDTIVNGRKHLGQDGIYFGQLPNLESRLTTEFPQLSGSRLRNLAPVHHYGLLATANACRDAGLSGDDLADAAVISARSSSDSWFSVFDDAIRRAEQLIEAPELDLMRARSIFTRLTVSGGTTDVAYVVADLFRSGGPTQVVSSGCASGGIAVGDALRLIQSGAIDRAVVVGADFYDLSRMLDYDNRLWSKTVQALEAQGVKASATGTLYQPMRPYDRRACGSNMANGAATLILESRASAARRGRYGYSRIMAQANRRNRAASALSPDIGGDAAIASARACLSAANVESDQIDYINGGSEGDAIYNEIESTLVRNLLGDRADGFPVSVQEACFGHSGAPLGPIGVAATALMMRHGRVCPTAGCDEPADVGFDPLPGTESKPHDIEYALSFNYHLGGGASAILMKREEATVAHTGGNRLISESLQPVGVRLVTLGRASAGFRTLADELSRFGFRPCDDGVAGDVLLVPHIGNEANGCQRGGPLDRRELLGVLEAMESRGGGCAILITDAEAQVNEGAEPDAAGRRAADLAWWQQQARRLAARNVRLNTIMVGYTPFLGHRLDATTSGITMQFRLVQRVVTVDDVAATVRLLASRGAGHTFGETIPLDGGMASMLVPPAPAAELAKRFTMPDVTAVSSDLFDLSGRWVMVIGASGGIGRATAVECARRGASLLLLGRQSDRMRHTVDLVTDAGARSQCLTVDLRDPEQTYAVVEEAQKLTGTIDSLVYAAGVLTFDGKGNNATVRDLANRVNYLSYAAATDALLGQWIPSRHPGAIAAVASVSAIWAPVGRTQAYGASKAAMLQHTRLTATGAARYGVRANTVLPGIIDTPMTSRTPNSPEFTASHMGQLPQGRIGKPEEVAALACYLISPAAGQVSGAALRVDGGGSLGCLPGPRSRAATG